MTTAGAVRESGERPNSVLGKVSLILSAFGDDDYSLGLAELRSRTGIAKNSSPPTSWSGTAATTAWAYGFTRWACARPSSAPCAKRPDR
jgi:hypothetical protein